MSSKINFICFADSRLQNSVNRLHSEIKAFTMIDSAYFYSEKDFEPFFRKELHQIRHPRGYGYWKWKSYLVKKTIDKMNENDIVIWSDVGNVFNNKGKQRFLEYLEMVHKSETGIVAFLQEGNCEKWWTKGDLFKFLNVYDAPSYTDTPQIWAGAFILKKTPTTIELINRWYDIHMNHYDLTTDKRSKVPNLSGFREHRHDQSVFSLLIKSYNSILINANEVNCGEGGWEKQERYPIWGCRKKDFHQSKMIKKLLAPYKWITNRYLVVFEQMDFNQEFKW